ncbi:MAG: acetate--CoA ligase [Fimbriimonadaceae bacterium]|nr:acetate--CoA ligase [Fimbriimonadaceae bacterium]QYK55979.1 MAG: acetate--CoA ligase [Fimbriimonadaceae bacterium]
MNDNRQGRIFEKRVFPPPADFAARANVRDRSLYEEADRDRIAFWESWARKLHWEEPWHTPLVWENPFAQWFVGGKLNACYNCVDRHVEAGLGDKTAFISEGEPGDVRHFTYQQVQDEVSRIANGLKSLGVGKGDRVCLYLPMVAELPMAMLACARIGAIHSVVFGGFAAESLHERINDAGAKVLLTADGGWRKGHVVELKRIADEALELGCPTIEKVVVLDRITPGITATADHPRDYDPGVWTEGRDLSWAEVVKTQSTECPCVPMDAEDPLFILYTSGSTGHPKGIVHSTGGYLTQAAMTAYTVFDLKPEDVFWCTADCGWITGHSYVTYGPMANAATQVLYEGAPDSPGRDRFWEIIEKHSVTILYTAPTTIRTFMKWGDELVQSHDLSSLRLLGSVGEPINPEAWMWYRDLVGGGRCPVVDTYWQTETGAVVVSPLPGLSATKPGSATQPMPGMAVGIFAEDGRDITPYPGSSPGEVTGLLGISEPWPSMLRGIWGDPERYKATYWGRLEGTYFAGDGAMVDEDGCFWLLGRVDDVIIVAGHNISSMEVESALVDHVSVAEAAVIGRAHEVKGQAISAFVLLRAGYDAADSDQLVALLKEHVAHKIGPIARPEEVFVCADLPKTRSGKIMRRLLRDIAEGRALGDTTTLADRAVVFSLQHQYESTEG